MLTGGGKGTCERRCHPNSGAECNKSQHCVKDKRTGDWICQPIRAVPIEP
jgi:hypothetical protein